jgi:hypothetical protein
MDVLFDRNASIAAVGANRLVGILLNLRVPLSTEGG